MEVDWRRLESDLNRFWEALVPLSPIISGWQPCRRFTELTYAREELVGSYKTRKYTSLIPWMEEQGFQRVQLLGSSHSSNIPRLSLLLRQRGIQPSYVVEKRVGQPVGNGLISRLILGSDFRVEGGNEPPCDWSVPEGASCPPALAGSLGIAGSFVRQALNHRNLPQDLYIDSGTGFTAAALLLGLGFFRLPCRVTIITMTRQERVEIDNLIESLEPEYQRLFKKTSEPLDYTITPPPIGRSFGSTPARVLAEIEEMAQLECILTDPLYTAKLSLAYQKLREPTRSALMFVSGGVRDLLGFQGPLQKRFAVPEK